MIYANAYLTLATQQFAALVTFYSGLLQQSPDPYWPGYYAEFLVPGLRLGIFPPRPDQVEEFCGRGASAMSLCLTVEDLGVAIAHLGALGYPPVGPIRSASHGLEVYAYDPDGNRLILHQPQPV
ncbi:MAG: VOC family protein [Nodosilinea sp.]|jgi:predicted enzyme related to lactoylglutathione lyase